MRRSKLSIIVLLICFAFNAFAEQQPSQHNCATKYISVTDKRVFGYGTFVDFYIPFGIGYVANLSTDMARMNQKYSFQIPIGFAVDTRFIAWFSIFTGLDFLFELQSFSQDVEDAEDNISHIYYNLQLQIPLVVKFYPFVSKGEQYENMYFGAGLLAHFCPARFYGVNDGSGIVYGNVYDNDNVNAIPSATFAPANVGIRLAMGNTFMFKDTAGFGLELYCNYLFVPTVSGYWSDPNYIIKDNPYLNFQLTVGVLFSIAIRGYSSLRE